MSRDLTGETFGDWTVVARAESVGAKAKWTCRCVCGREKAVFATHLVRGLSKTCTNSGTHGIGKKTPGYTSYSSMLTRCRNPAHPAFHRYGGRGISVCARWQTGFEAFYEDMGPRPAGLTLDRIDSNGNYEPGNCRWATPQEQQNNTSTNRVIERGGAFMTIAQLARATGVKYETLYSRLKRTGEI